MRNGGPEALSGPPVSLGPSWAFMRSRASRSSFAAVRWSGSSGRTAPARRHRERHDGLRPSELGLRRARGSRHHGLEASPPGRAGLARTFQHSHSFGNLSVRENVEVSALGVGAAPRDARRRATQLLDLLGIAPYAEAPASVLPHGEERKLEVARALAIEPRFVLMDEPAAGLPEIEIPEFAHVLRSVRDERGAGVLLIDHNMALVMEVCDRIHVLDQGKTLAEGTPEAVRANLDVAAAYLGESAVREDVRSDEHS